MAHKITIIYGSEACNFMIDGHTATGTIRKINNGELEGMSANYELDTKHDLDVLKKALEDFDGWLNYAIIEK